MCAALLCNGPSRILFTTPENYDYIMGCNIPWTKVDSTVVLDNEIVRTLYDNSLIQYPIWFSENAWRETKFKNREYFKEYFLGLVKTLPEYDSCGHVACRKLIELGYTKIDIYGCDSWFVNDTSSYTHQFDDTRSSNTDKHVIEWRKRWNTIIENHKDISINFIG